MFKRALSLFLAILMAAGMFPFTSLTAYAAKKKDVNYFYPTMDTVREYQYIERANMEFSGNSFKEGCQIEAWPTGKASIYTFNYIGSFYEYKNSEEYMSSVLKVARDISNEYFDVEINEVIIYRVDRGDGFDPLYGAVVAYDPMDGVIFYAVSSESGSPVLYNFTNTSGYMEIDVEYYTDHGLGTKEIYHTVTYRDDDGTFLSDQEVRSGKNAINPSAPVKNGVTGQWNHTGEFIESDTEIFADYTGGEVYAPERPEDYYLGGQPFIRNDYNQQAVKSEIVPTDVENLVVGHTYTDVRVIAGLWDNHKMQLKELGTYGELNSREGYSFGIQFQKLCEYLSETYSFSINEIMCYDSGASRGPCVVMGYDYEYNAVAIAYSLMDLQIYLYYPTDLRDKDIDITFDIDIMSGHATRKTHTVKYVTESGSPICTFLVQDGKSVPAASIPGVPEKNGYEGVWSNDGTGITSDRTIYPVYSRIGGEKEDNGPYTVNFYMPAWIVNLRRDEPLVNEETGEPYADEDPVLIYSEQVEHEKDVQYIPTIPYEASKAYEWYDWNYDCKLVTENKDVIVTKQYGGKRVFAFWNNEITGGMKPIVCGSTDSAYGLIHNITPIDWPDTEPYMKKTEIGDWTVTYTNDKETTYYINSIDVLPENGIYMFIGSYTDGPRFPESGVYYNITPSTEHLSEDRANYGIDIGYKGIFGDLTAKDLYGNASDAAARYENLKKVVNEVAANYKISPNDVPIHNIVVRKTSIADPDEEEYVIWLSYNYHDDYAFLISEYGHNYFINGDGEHGKNIGLSFNGTIESISEKALKLAGKEAAAVDMCEITFVFDGKVISKVEAAIGSEYKLPEPMPVRGYKAEGWKLNGKLVGKEVFVEGKSMSLEASYVPEEGTNKGLESLVFSYAYYFNGTMRGFTTDKGTVNLGKLTNPRHNGTPMADMTGEFTLEYFGTYDDLKDSKNEPVIRKLWEDILVADEEYTPTAKNLPIYKLFWDGEFVCYGIIRAYDAEKGIMVFDGPYHDVSNNYVLSMAPLNTKENTIVNINYDGSALPYFSVDTTADNVFFEYAWNIDRINKLGAYGASGKTDPVVDQYGTVGNVSGKWNLEKLGKYSEIKDEIYTAYLDSTIQIAANLHGVSADDVIVYDFRNGNTHVAYGSILVQAGGDYGDTKLLFIGDTAKEGSFFAISHVTEVEGYYAAMVIGNKDYSAAIKKGFDEYVTVSFYAEDVKVADILIAKGKVITELPEVPAKEGYTGSWEYDGFVITEETRIDAIYISASGEELDNPNKFKNYKPLDKELEDKLIVAIRSGNSLLSYASNEGFVVEEDENGEIAAPSKKVQWRVSINEDGSISFINTTTGKLLAVVIDENGNAKIATVVDEEETNPGGEDIPGIEEGEPVAFTSLEGEEPGENPEEPGENPEEPIEPEESEEEPEIIASYYDWVVEMQDENSYLKLSDEENSYYLALSEEGEWVAAENGSKITFWQNPEEPSVPEEPVEPEKPANGALSKEELDANRPENAPKGSYYPISKGESFEDGDRIIIYVSNSIRFYDQHLAFNGETGRLADLGCEYDSETGAINDLDVPEEYVWIVNTANCAHGCCETAYTLKNAKTGEYLVYTDNNKLDYVKDPVAGRNGVKTFVWHYTTGDGFSVDGIERVRSGWRAYDEYKNDLHYYGNLNYPDVVGGEFYATKAFDGRLYNVYAMNRYEIDGTREYCAVQYIADGELYKVEYVTYGSVITQPEVPEKEGYSGRWLSANSVTITEDTIFEAVYSEDIRTVYFSMAYSENSSNKNELNYWESSSDPTIGEEIEIKIRDVNDYHCYVHNGYHELKLGDYQNEEFVLGDLGYLKDFPDESVKQFYEKEYKSKIVKDYGEEVYDNLKLYSISQNGQIVAIGFFSSVWGAYTLNREYLPESVKYMYALSTGDEVAVLSDVELEPKNYFNCGCEWNLSCDQNLFALPFTEQMPSYTVTFKDLDGNIIYQEEVLRYGDLQVVPAVPEKEGCEGTWFASENLYTNVIEDTEIYPIYYKVVAEKGALYTKVEYREFFDGDYATATKEIGFNHSYYTNFVASHNPDHEYISSVGYADTVFEKKLGNTITLGYIGTIQDLALYTEKYSQYVSIEEGLNEENYKNRFTWTHYDNVTQNDYASEYEVDLPVYAYINEETGELLDVVVLYAAFAMKDPSGVEHAALGFFDPGSSKLMSYYSLAPKTGNTSDKYSVRPLWHFKDGLENFSIDLFKNLKNIKVTYLNEFGETIYEEMVCLNGSVENVPAVPEKYGYTGVWDHDGTDIIGDTVIRPVYTVITHKVTINLYDGKTYELEIVHGEDVGLPDTPPEVEGYIGSWDHDGKNITEDTVINAIYEKQPFVVTFVVDDAVVATQEVKTGESVTLPGIPEKVGLNGKWNHDGKNITADTIITAVYTAKTYEVTFYANGTTVDVQMVEHGQSAVVPEVPAKAGYTGEWNGDTTRITSDIIIRAKYTPIKYNVLYFAGDDLISRQKIAYGGDAEEPDVPEREGYGGEWNHDGKNITSDTFIDAVYTAKKYTVKFYDGIKLVKKVTVKHGEDVDLPEVPTKEGYTSEWDHDGRNITKDTKINVEYTPIKYRVVFYVDGEFHATRSVEHGDKVKNVPDIPEVEGKSGKWDTPLNNITSNLSVHAIYTDREYKVTFYLNGKAINTQTVKYGENVSFPNVAQVEGCTLVWDKDGNNVKSDLKIYGTYKLNGYTVDKVSGTTNEAIPSNVYYGFSYGNEIGTGKNEKLDLTKLNSGNEAYDLIFWKNETGESGSFTLHVPAQVEAPVVEMDYSAGTTKDIVGTDVYYGTNVNAMFTTGTNEKLSLVPETTYYFYRPSDGERLPSDITVVNVGKRPEKVEVTIDYVGGTTNEVIGTEVEFAVSDTELSTEEAKALEFSGRGSGEKLSPEKRDTAYYMYFRVAATDKDFASEITKVYVGPKGTVPNLAIDYYSERTYRMLGSDTVYGYSEDEMIFVGNYEYLDLIPGQDVYACRKGSDSEQKFASDVVHLVVPERPVIETLFIEDETIKGKGDGKISGLTAGVKYRWHPADATWDYYNQVITGDAIEVAPGEWQIRIQAVDDVSFASEYYNVTIGEGRTITLTLKADEDGEVLSVVEGLSYREAIPVPEDPTREGYTFNGWYWNDNGTERRFSFNSGIIDDTTVYAKWTASEGETVHNELYGDKWVADFGTVFEDEITIPEAINVTITNNGQSDINIIWEEPVYYSVSGPETIAAGASAVYTIQPLESLAEAGNYDEEILIYNADNFDSYYFISALYTIEGDEDFDVTVKEDGKDVGEGGIVVEIGEEIELEAGIDSAPEKEETPVLYSRFRAVPVAKAVPAGYSVSWEDTSGNVISTELKCKFGPFAEEGYYHYILVVTGPKGNSVKVPFTIYAGEKENDNRITITPKYYRFGTDRSKAAEFIISNFNGNEAVELTNFGSLKEFKGEGESIFIFGGELFERIVSGEKVVLQPGESISFTVQPKEGLEPGVYAEMVGAGVGNGTNYALAAVGYTEPEKLDIDTENEVTAFVGGNFKLSAKAIGGSGKYTYEWVNTETGKVVSRKSSALFGSSYTKEAGTLNLEVRVTDSYGNTFTEKVKVNIIERNCDIIAEPGKLDFGTDYRWFRNAKEQTVTIKNIGNSEVTLKGIESRYFDVTDISGIVLKPGESIEITVVPKDGLGVGDYYENIFINTEEETEARFAAYYRVIKVFGNSSETKPNVPEKSDDEQNPNTGAEVILP